uniref:Uncharacterized protein n=1 Tax=Polaromonas sp. H6N TaxID=1840293 RepID=A0A2S1FI96_9BURK|nr:BPSL0761 family protein [Polaromonas sp. H6N]AWD72228.1 hypothetical protein pH6NP1_p032 [Polaromonas sp. H6N]
MTMPDERTRSLRWGFEFLGEMRLDETIDAGFRATAQRLQLTYPRPDQILEWIEADAPGLPQAAARALGEAGELWTRLQFSRQGTQETRHALRFVQRHFPEPGLSRLLGNASREGLQHWLLPEEEED